MSATFETNNNIFTYATSELRQDAFLFYLLNFANTDTNEGKLARNFLKLFTQNRFINEENYKNFKIYSYKQFIEIDVLMIFVNENNPENSFILIIEDKINANAVEWQLAGYVNNFRKENVPEMDINGNKIRYTNLTNIKLENIIYIYFKTGALDTSQSSYKNLIGLESIFECLESVSTNNIIIEQWKEKIFIRKSAIDRIQTYINENKKIGDLKNLVDDYTCDELDVANAIGKFIFGETADRNYETWKINAQGHPECDLNIKPLFLIKECDDQEYKSKNQNKKLVLEPVIRFRNFKLCIILQITILNSEDKYIGYADRNFLKNNSSNINCFFKEERKKFYDSLKLELNSIKDNEKFKNIKIGNLKSGNIMLTKFNQNEILELNLKDFKKFILELQESLEKVAIKLNYKKQW